MLTVAQRSALEILVEHGPSETSNRTRVLKPGKAIISGSVATFLQREGLAVRVFNTPEPTVWDVVNTPVKLKITEVGRTALDKG